MSPITFSVKLTAENVHNRVDGGLTYGTRTAALMRSSCVLVDVLQNDAEIKSDWREGYLVWRRHTRHKLTLRPHF